VHRLVVSLIIQVLRKLCVLSVNRCLHTVHLGCSFESMGITRTLYRTNKGTQAKAPACSLCRSKRTLAYLLERSNRWFSALRFGRSQRINSLGDT